MNAQIKKKCRLRMDQKRKLEGFVFLSPLIIGIMIFFVFPLYLLIRLSFGDIVKITGFQIEWVGFENFLRAFVVDINFVPMLLDSIGQMLSRLPLIIIFSFLLAILMNKNVKMKGFFKTVFFLPFLLGTGHIMMNILGQDVNGKLVAEAKGIFLPEEILVYLGDKVNEIVDKFFGIIVLVLWSSSVQIFLFLSGIQAIPNALYESARIDGATEWEMLWKITLPMVSPITMLNIIYTIVILMTDMTNPIMDYIYQYSFRRDYEYGAAMGTIYCLFILILVMIVLVSMRRVISNASVERSDK